ncbi:unnamed protein product [Rotaria sp. Silwood1]|nr:unnamed protein product [Rotaria sp. Silwood1]CAF1393155.1 unnamed protein product [Rotaria sp. Silwood1]CAF3601570.1 unnamed protein product [Rotaria sp. Silwood1]CAF4921462.1 unnamed protein product [Rotaria sp. Silwood1]CAF4924678.1 unnamed protein product [Rotaria sp. Silwood1]
MKDLAKECSEPEITELISMHEPSKKLQTLFEIHHNRYEQTPHHRWKETRDAVLRQRKDDGGTKQRLSQFPMMNLKQYPNVFRHLPYAFTDMAFVDDIQANNWQKTFWTSTEFQCVIATKG